MKANQKSRVIVDFPMHERDLLQVLCDLDFRPPQEQLRWLVTQEVIRRNLPETNDLMEKIRQQVHQEIYES